MGGVGCGWVAVVGWVAGWLGGLVSVRVVERVGGRVREWGQEGLKVIRFARFYVTLRLILGASMLHPRTAEGVFGGSCSPHGPF